MENYRVYKCLNGQNYDIGYKENGVIYPEFEKTLVYLIALGRSIHPNFKLDPADRPLYRLLFGYYLREMQFCQKKVIDLNKGILLFGPTGVGKTVILKLFASFFTSHKRKIDFYTMQSISELGNEYGSQFLSKLNFNRDIVLDDIGNESLSIHYGDRFESLKLILNKYEEVNFSFVKPGEFVLTNSFGVNRISSTRKNTVKPRKIYATTNLDLRMLHERYGERVTSRIADYFNVISFTSQEDKRTANANIVTL